MSSKLSLAVFFVAACGGSSTPSVDAPTSNVPAMIKISGIATQQAASGTPPPASGVLVAAYKSSDENTIIAMDTTAADGSYMLMITTGGQPLDGFLKATLAGNADTYLFPPAPLVADFTNASINELDTNLYGLVAVSLGRGQPGQGMIALEVTDASMATVAGVAVSSTPAAPHTGYTASNGLPDTSATVTIADGRAYLFGLAPGSVTVNATMTGATYKSHAVKTYADSFTTTVITP